MTRAVVVGGTGFTGSRTSSILFDRGFEVLALSGHPDRPHPLKEVRVGRLCFDDPAALKRAIDGAQVLYNTYWIRFERGSTTFEQAVANTLTLFKAAKEAGVKKIVHISITNPSEMSKYPYFRGKAVVEGELAGLGVPYTILRPALVFGKGDVLINNIAWVLRSYHMFPIFGEFRVCPIFVDDLARAAVERADTQENEIVDCIGPECFTFRELVRTVAVNTGARALLFRTSPKTAYRLSGMLSWIIGEPVVTPDEIGALVDNLLYVEAKPIGRMSLADWVAKERDSLGRDFASEIQRHYTK